MEEAERVCDKIMILVNGKIVALGSPEQLRRHIKGFQLIVEKRAEDSKEEIRVLIATEIPEAGFVDAIVEDIGDFAVSIKLQFEGSLAQRIEVLDKMIIEDRILGFKIAHLGLQDVFYKLSEGQQNFNS